MKAMKKKRLPGMSIATKTRFRTFPVPLLTRRQTQILKHVAAGRTNREIAQKLRLSTRTVEVHRFNLNRRLRAHNADQLVRTAKRWELLP